MSCPWVAQEQLKSANKPASRPRAQSIRPRRVGRSWLRASKGVVSIVSPPIVDLAGADASTAALVPFREPW
jgi:hypothetical protein